MVLKYNEFIKEGLRDQMKGKSEEDIDEIISSMIYKGEYLILTPTIDGLKIELTEKGKEEIKYSDFWELFEDIQGNSDYKFHPDLSWDFDVMTEAPGITYEYTIDDHGEWEEIASNSYLYYFDDYIINSFFDILSENGEVIFKRQ